MLDSDIVASKRDQMAIQNRLVFIRQSLVEMLPEASYAFACFFNHSKMFLGGTTPSPTDFQGSPFDRVKTRLSLRLNDYETYFSLELEDYEHYAAGVIRLSGLGTYEQPLFMYLGFDLDFNPVCLITTCAPGLSMTDTDNPTIHSTSPKNVLPRVPLNWLLSEVAGGETSTTIMAFRGRMDASAQVLCKSLRLLISLEIRSPIRSPEPLSPPMWCITFAELPLERYSPISNTNVAGSNLTPIGTDGPTVVRKQVDAMGRLWSKIFPAPMGPSSLPASLSRRRDNIIIWGSKRDRTDFNR